MTGNPRWTEEQEAAITAKGSDVLVSAAAGSGKTSVLVERLIRKILDAENPVSVDRLLVVTFTESAALEMKERIRAALSVAARLEGSAEATRQLSLLGRASISTLHAFCLRVLRRYYYLIGLDPAFRVMDQEEARLLFIDVMDRLFEEAHAGDFLEGRAGFADLLLHYGGSRDDRDLRQIVGDLHDYACSVPDGRAWLERAERAATGEDGGRAFSEWRTALCRAAAVEIGQALTGLKDGLALCSLGNGPETYASSLEAAAAALERVAAALDSSDWDAAAAGLQSVPWPRLKSPEDADPLLQGRVRDLWDRSKKTVRTWLEGAFCRTEAEYREDFERIGPVVSSLRSLVTEFGERYRRAKRERGAVDFSDLERMALDILERDNGRVASEYRDAFDEVMVDEYQDINPVQDRLLSLVSRDEKGRRNRFLVGDVKQSIYRFRLADPSIFQEKHERFAAVDDPDTRRIDLQANFRSHPEIVAFVNYVFRQVMQRETGEIAYGPDAFLRAKGLFEPGDASPRVDVHLVERLDDDADDEPGLPAVEREAIVIGRIIRALTAPDREGGSFKYRDIAILMRSPKGRTARFTDILEGMGVPVHARAGSGFFAAVEVDVILNVLRLLDNPRQDIPLAAVLRSPIGGLDSRELAEIRAHWRDASFYDAAAALSQEESDLGRKLRAFLAELDEWRTAARRGSLSQLLWRLYHETGYVDFVAGLPRGRQRESNLWGLYHRAKQFDRFRTQGLDRFLAYVDGLDEAGEEVAPPPALGEGEDVVQLISVHQSKGLEFPVVIIADLDRKWNVDETRRSVIFHRSLGIGPSVVDRDRHIRYPSLAHRAVSVQTARDALAEEMRLLYVALTRAKERLVLVGSARDLENRCAKWSESALREGWPLPAGDVLGANSWLDWLGRSLARHRGGEALRALGAGDMGPEYFEPVDDEVARSEAAFSLRVWTGREVDRDRPDRTNPGGSHEDGGRRRREDPLAHLADPGAPEGAKDDSEPSRDEPVHSKLERLYGWTYPHLALTRAPAKVTVTEVARLVDADESAVWESTAKGLSSPRTLAATPSARTVSAAERGTAIHLVLSRIDPNDLADAPSIGRQVESLVERGLLTRAHADAVDVSQIAAFFQTELGRRIAGAARLWRELPFTMRLDSDWLVRIASSLGSPLGDDVTAEQLEANGSAVVQGTIDCIAQDGSGTLLIDYKTDRVVRGGEVDAAGRYRDQLALYLSFVTKWLRPTRIEAYVVFLETGTAVRLEA